MIYKRSIVLLGVFLSNFAPAAAQKTAPQMVPAREHAALAITMFHPVLTPSLNASFLLYQDPRNTPAQFSLLSAGADEPDYIVAPLPPINEVKTLLFTQSSMPLLPALEGTPATERLSEHAFPSKRAARSFRLWRCAGAASTTHLSRRPAYSRFHVGVSLSFHFGRNARAAGPTQAWRYLSRIVSNVLH